MTNDTVLSALKSATPKELVFINKVINRSMRKHISINEAVKIEKFQPGSKVTFSDKDGKTRIGDVRKVMSKKIRIFDRKAKAEVAILPQELSPYEPKKRGATPKAKAEAPKAKRTYTRKAKPEQTVQ